MQRTGGAGPPFRPAPDFDLGIRGGPVLPAGIVGRDPVSQPLAVDRSRYCLVWSPVTPSGQKVALAAVLYGLLDLVSVLVPGRGRLAPAPGRDGGYRWSPELPEAQRRAMTIGASVRTPTLVDGPSSTVVSNDPYLLPYALRDLAARHAEASAGTADRPPLLALIGDPDQERYWDARIFEDFHAAVYQAGFVDAQDRYQDAVDRVHRFLFDVEEHLSDHAFLCGAQCGPTDLYLFSLLVRFDQVYAPGFRLHRYRIRDFPTLWRYLRTLYSVPACAFTTDFAEISAGYFLGIPALNRKVVPVGPDDLFIRS